MLQIVLLFIGVVGLAKRKIHISSKREISGTPVVLLSCFYLLAAVMSFFFGFQLITIGVIGVVTLLVVIFVKGQPVNPAPVAVPK